MWNNNVFCFLFTWATDILDLFNLFFRHACTIFRIKCKHAENDAYIIIPYFCKLFTKRHLL